MSLRDQIAADAEAVFLNTDELAETVQINGSGSAVAVVEVGEDPGKGNGLASDGSAAMAQIWVSAEDLPTPSVSDTITDASGRVWRVVRFLRTSGAVHCLLCSADEGVRF